MSQNHHSIPNPNQSTLTPEDEFLLELLVDGELDEVQRNDLLRRLDHLPDGWRRCAVAFLEAQCLRETFRNGSSPSVLAESTPLSVTHPSKDDSRPEDAAMEALLKKALLPSFTDPSPSDVSRDPKTDSIPEGPDPFQIPTPDSKTTPEDDPVIIPLRRPGFRPFANRRSDGSSRHGHPLRFFGLSAMSGFLFAIVLAGLFGERIWKDAPVESTNGLSSFARSTGSESLEANSETLPAVDSFASDDSLDREEAMETQVAKNSEFLPASPLSESATPSATPTTDGFYFAKDDTPDVSAPYGSSRGLVPDRTRIEGVTPVTANNSIRQVTLKTSDNDLGISIPCVETESYDPRFLRSCDSENYVNQLRKDGCQVNKRYEEMMFPLKDGKMLIVPVETINILRPGGKETVSTQNFQ